MVKNVQCWFGEESGLGRRVAAILLRRKRGIARQPPLQSSREQRRAFSNDTGHCSKLTRRCARLEIKLFQVGALFGCFFLLIFVWNKQF